MPIQDLAREAVVSTTPDTPVTELAQMMRDESVGSIVITNEQKPVGIVTDRDLSTRVVAEGADPNEHIAEDVMTTDLCMVDPNAGFYEATAVMSENGVRRLPVCDEADELVGIITADDLTELLSEEHEHLVSVIRNQRPSY
jgi:signal-transduction protein with cAMP-binding, CBS, and nucleotidyltransferase domain